LAALVLEAPSQQTIFVFTSSTGERLFATHAPAAAIARLGTALVTNVEEVRTLPAAGTAPAANPFAGSPAVASVI
jgi:hypothetical protein